MGKHRRARRARDSRLRTLRYEPLEDRRLLAVVTVNTPLDVIDLTDGVTSLREAIFATNLVGGADEINFDFGDTNPHTILLEHGELQITDSLTIIGPGAALLTIDASGSDPTPGDDNPATSRIFNIDDHNNSVLEVELEGLALTGVNNFQEGGAINSWEALTISHCSIYGNTAGLGAAIKAWGELLISHSTITGNRALGKGGGILASGRITISDCLVTNNSGRDGGGIFAKGEAVVISDCIISGNDGHFGGGVFFGAKRGEIVNCTISDNSASGGGGICIAGTVAISGSTIANNSAFNEGGGIKLGGVVTIQNSAVTDNTAESGGGISAFLGTWSVIASTISNNSARTGGGISTALGRATIIGSTISGNAAENGGGGIWSLKDLFIAHSTIVKNTANSDGDIGETGGGVFVIAGTANLDHTVVAGNHDGSGTAQDIAGVVNATYSLIGFGANFLGPLADNGGPTQTHALLPGSPAINAGDPNFTGPPDSDQRGFPYQRVSGGRIDIGAFEAQPLPGDFDHDGDSDADDLALWETTYAANNGMSGLDFLAWQVMQPAPSAPAIQALSSIEPPSEQIAAVTTLEATPPIIVTTELDVVDFTDGLTSLREAIFAANLVGGANEITFDFGDANPHTILLQHGELQITDSLTITGPGAAMLTIDASGNDLSPGVGDGSSVFNINDGDNDSLIEVTISDMTITGADTHFDIYLDRGGAIKATENVYLQRARVIGNRGVGTSAIALYAGNLSIVDSVISANTSIGRKYTATIVIDLGHLSITDSVISGNTCPGEPFSVGVVEVHRGSAEVVRAEIINNSAGEQLGGAAALDVDGLLTMTDSVVSGNQNLGGVNLRNRDASGLTSEIKDSTISENGWAGVSIALRPGDQFSVRNSTISNNAGTGIGNDWHLGLGGARVQIIGSTISGNTATRQYAEHYGRTGGIALYNGIVSILDTVVSDNTGFEYAISANKYSSGGGGIHIRTKGEVTISRTSVDRNSIAGISDAVHHAGGGITLENATSTITDCDISDNSSPFWAGGLRIINGATTITGSTITGNTAAHVGGGIYFSANTAASGTLSIIDTLVGHNSAADAGGIAAGGTTNIVRSTISDNSADSIGGGISMLSTANASVVISTITGNESGRSGGGIYVGPSANLSIKHSTITNNATGALPPLGSPTGGGGISVRNPLVSVALSNTIVAGNTDATGIAPDIAGVVNASYSLIGFGANFLGPLADNGGPTPTHALLPGSPAINAGDPNFTGPPDSDQRGFPYQRVSGGRIDIGAFEAQPLPGDFDHDGDSDADDLALWEASYATNPNMSGLDFLAWQLMQPAPAIAVQALSSIEPQSESIAAVATLAATPPIIVTTELDVVDFTDGLTSLREAIFATNLVAGADEINFNFGDANPHTILLEHGELQITDSLTITGLGADLLTIDASGNDPTPDSTYDDGDFTNDRDGSRVFFISDDEESILDVSIAGLTLTGGDATSRAAFRNRGGAISSEENLTVVECIIANNFAPLGGGIASRTPFGGTLTIVRSTIRDNAGDGGGISTKYTDLTIVDSVIDSNTAGFRGGGIAAELGTVKISGSSISNNSVGYPYSFRAQGGGIWYQGSDTLTITGSTINNNSAGDAGGGILSFSAGGLVVNDSIISGNKAFGGPSLFGSGGGGGIASNFATITGSTISGNYARSYGGGILATDVSILNSTISGNTADLKGGGLYLFSATNASIVSSTISGNESGRSGGGVYVGSSSNLTIKHSTITGNTTGDLAPPAYIAGGGGIHLRNSSVALDHTIVAGNTDATGIAPDIAGVVNASYSLIGFGANFLGPLADNGGPTPTHALLPGSPAINAGDPNFTGPPDSDQRGFPYQRVSGGRIDIGAFEAQPLPGDFDHDGDSDADDLPVWEASYATNPNMNGLDFLAWQIMQPAPAAPAIQAISSIEPQSEPIATVTPLEATPPIIVTTELDVVDFTDGLTSLREAIFAANIVPGEQTIEFAPSLAGDLLLLSMGELAITDELNIHGLGADQLTIDAQHLSRIFSVTSGAGDATLADLTLRGGESYFGGAVSSESAGTLTIEGCVITDNRATGSDYMLDVNGVNSGGGIYARGNVIVLHSEITHNRSYGSGGGIFSRGDVHVVDSTISHNEIPSWDPFFGAAFPGGGGVHAEGAITVESSDISHNHGGQFGGGINAVGNVTVLHSTIEGNSNAWAGGGIFSNGLVTINDSTITENTTDGAGGGIAAYGGLDLHETTVSNNRSQGMGPGDVSFPRGPFHEGGGIAVHGNATIRDSSVSGNTTTGYGGGIFHNLGLLTLVNSTISGNSGVQGGGIAMIGSNLLLEHSTVTGNHSQRRGGGIASFFSSPTKSYRLSHSIVAGNTAAEGGPDLLLNGVLDLSYSLIGNNTGTAVAGGGASNQPLPEAPIGSPDAHGNLIGGPIHGVIDPRLAPLADNGGPTKTHALLPGSPAINAGDLNAHTGLNGVPEFDQRGPGFPRIFGGRIDIGAYEYQAPSDLNLLVDTLVDESDGNYSRGDLSLREAIELANTWAGHDTIHFDPTFTGGTIVLTQGELVISDVLAIDGLGSSVLTINARNQSRIFNITAPTGDFSISGLKLTRGRTSGFNYGGAIRSASYGRLTIEDCLITGNSAGTVGGGVFSSGPVSVLNTTISNNQAVDGYGGGIASRYNIDASNSIITGNTANRNNGILGWGGGIFSLRRVTLTDSEVSHNSTLGGTSIGGGVFAFEVSMLRSKVLSNQTFGNRGDGGGVRAVNIFEAVDSVIAGNSTHGNEADGGGISNSSTLTLLNSVVSGNGTYGKSSNGGGIRAGHAEITNSTVSGNFTAGINSNGAGIYVEYMAPIPMLTVQHSTITDNNTVSGTGGGIWSEVITTIEHSIVAGNTAGNDSPDLSLNPTKLILSHSLIGNRGSVALNEAPVGSPDAHGNRIGGPIHGVIDPLLAPLADNGGPTPTHALLPGSPAINAGDLNVHAGLNGVPEFDQRGPGFPRIFGGRIDIGAYEYQAPSDLNLLVDTLVDESDGDFSRGDLSLREAIELANTWAGQDTIHFDPALAGGTILVSLGAMEIDDALTINGLGADLLTIDGQRKSGLFSVLESAADVSFSGLTLTRGSGSGAITSQAALSLQEMSFVDNRGGLAGGVLAGGDLMVKQSRFERNTAVNAGAIMVLAENRTITIDSSTFADNWGTLGFAIDARLDASSFTASSLKISSSSTFSKGIHVSAKNQSEFVLRTSTVSGAAAGTGLQIEMQGDSSSTIESSTIFNNGTGIRSSATDFSSLLIRSTTVSGNTNGGMLLGGNVTIAHSTITKNTGFHSSNGGDTAGGLSFGPGTLHLDHSIIAGNFPRGSAPADVGGIINATNSLIGYGAEFLGPLADNGGPTPTHALLPGNPARNAGSPAINAGDPNFTGPPDSDQRGFPFTRVSGGRIDIGAFELQPPPGDFNHNLLVEHDDLPIWEASYGTNPGMSGLDFLAWQLMYQPAAPALVSAEAPPSRQLDPHLVDLAITLQQNKSATISFNGLAALPTFARPQIEIHESDPAPPAPSSHSMAADDAFDLFNEKQSEAESEDLHPAALDEVFALV